MPPEQLQRYLAEHYMSGAKSQAILDRYDDKKRKKKKKRVDEPSHGGMVIREDQALWFGAQDDDDDGDDDGVELTIPEGQVVLETSRASHKSQASAWQSVRDAEAATGASAAPALPPAHQDEPSAPSGSDAPPAPTERPRAGLMSREQLKAQREARKAAERAAAEAAAAEAGTDLAAEVPSQEQETVYRDAQGRRIDVAAEEARLQEEAAQAARMKEERKQWNRGVVQRQQEAAAREALAAAASEQVARHADDAHMNALLRERAHMDDPARAFLRRRGGRRVTRPQYEGPPPPPNRFGIRPGYRWDGVDRSTGFERKFLVSQNNAQRAHTEHHGTSPLLTQPGPPRTCSQSLLHIPAALRWDAARDDHLCGTVSAMASLPAALPLLLPVSTQVLELTPLPPHMSDDDVLLMLQARLSLEPAHVRVRRHDSDTVHVLFQEAAAAKRAYLALLCTPPPELRLAPGTPASPACPRLCGPYTSVHACCSPEAQAWLQAAGWASEHALAPAATLWPSSKRDADTHAARTHRRHPSNTVAPSRGVGGAPREARESSRIKSQRHTSYGLPMDSIVS